MKTARESATSTLEGFQGIVVSNMPTSKLDEIDWAAVRDEVEAIFDEVEDGEFPAHLGEDKIWENADAADAMLEALETYRQELFIAAVTVDTIILNLAEKLKRDRPAKRPITAQGETMARINPDFAKRLAQ